MILILVFQKEKGETLNEGRKMRMKIQNILEIYYSYYSELKFIEMKQDVIPKGEFGKSNFNIQEELQKINFPPVWNNTTENETGKSLSNWQNLKIVLFFTKLIIKGSIAGTLKALTDYGATLIISSANFGKNQYVSIEIYNANPTLLAHTKHMIISMLKSNPNLSGHLEFLGKKFRIKNQIISSLGICEKAIEPGSIRKIIETLPLCLEHSP
ncbi:MAG: hypothetical protein ACXAD7_19805 [Candidatus Kariarchaeaceae archaeon]|jgi:hypothetical protein